MELKLLEIEFCFFTQIQLKSDHCFATRNTQVAVANAVVAAAITTLLRFFSVTITVGSFGSF